MNGILYNLSKWNKDKCSKDMIRARDKGSRLLIENKEHSLYTKCFHTKKVFTEHKHRPEPIDRKMER